MTDIYTKFDTALRGISAYALLRGGKPVGRIVLKHANASTAYVHIWGSEMVSGRATGYGYDKAGAAVREALGKLARYPVEARPRARAEHDAFSAAIQSLGTAEGLSWIYALEAHGFTVAIVI